MSKRTKLLIRHGGEEFVAIILDTNKEELLNLAETLRTAVYEKRMDAPVKEIADYVTVSVGSAIVKLGSMEDRYENLLKEADEALYSAKKAGRNCVVFAEQMKESLPPLVNSKKLPTNLPILREKA